MAPGGSTWSNLFVCKSDLTADQVKLDPSMDVSIYGTSLQLSKHDASVASTPLTTNLCSPITRVTFSTIHVESSLEAQRNSKFCRNSFSASVEKGNYVIDYMLYGLDAQVFMMPTADGHL